MANSNVKEIAFHNLDLLKKVVEFKMKFYPRNWANYHAAKPGTLKLVPPDFRFSELQADYNQMRYMLYGNIPTFDQIMLCISELETEINEIHV